MKQYQIGTKKWTADSNFNFRNVSWELSNHKQLPQVKGQVTEVEFCSRDWSTNKLSTRSFQVKML